MNTKRAVSSFLAVVVILPIVLFCGVGVRADGTSRDFVNRIYKYVLERQPDESGAKYWTEQLDNGDMTGGEVAKRFLLSEEFTKKNMTDKAYVIVLYRTFFGREPDDKGLSYWTENLGNKKITREGAIDGFIDSQEWADICLEYHIISGGNKKPTNTSNIKPNKKTLEFTERLYTCAFERSSDQKGKEYWAQKLATYEVTGEQAAAAFFLSDEMKKANISDAVFVYRLYTTFMNRVPDLAGFNYWLGVMKKHPNDKYQVAVYGFSRSAEFVKICRECGIIPYNAAT